MTNKQAEAFIGAIFALQPYCPPLLFERVASSAAAAQLALIAQGTLTVTPKLPDFDAPAPSAPASQEG